MGSRCANGCTHFILFNKLLFFTCGKLQLHVFSFSVNVTEDFVVLTYSLLREIELSARVYILVCIIRWIFIEAKTVPHLHF